MINCMNCKHKHVEMNEQPCKKCFCNDQWEAEKKTAKEIIEDWERRLFKRGDIK